MHFAKEGQPRRGAYGEVSFGFDIQSGMPFAVKKIPIGEFNRREPRILNLCDNPNVIKLYGLIRRGNCIEIIMEKATNGTWFEMILNGPLQQQETLQCLLGALTGLEQLHRCSIIHRDLKPNNIGLMADGRVVILDLGSAITPDDTQDFVERRAGMSGGRAIPDTVEGFDAEDDLATDTPDQHDEPTSEAASGPLGDRSQANRNNENRGSIT
ncbi:serine/threonine-protein kinase 24-like [Lingula anatina]|uniref:Serine/threonine-protein kinase 24-like n=1 Tax=Lingula anatina TaxID=7574 RepID=A0A1S3H1L2_LINAN|nr:serine/threonine-protein kinase 24-like [Lingula anatina]|eukprot:XP_013379908.1 serine/threonine-protein kinase 24-like [Lingula anatina]